jgi:hypothetical protein
MTELLPPYGLTLQEQFYEMARCEVCTRPVAKGSRHTCHRERIAAGAPRQTSLWST